MTPAVLFPIGHYLGPFHPGRDEPARHHVVRVGWDTPKLPDEAHVDIWALTHGLPARIDTVPWTRDAVLEAAADAGMTDADTILETLLQLGLVAEVGADAEGARAFAARYRLQSLLVGLGNSPDDPALDGIGLIGLPPLVRVRPRVFEVWQWAHLWPSLWSAAEGMAQVAREVEGEGSEYADPDRMLGFLLVATRKLVAHNAAYLDIAQAGDVTTG